MRKYASNTFCMLPANKSRVQREPRKINPGGIANDKD